MVLKQRVYKKVFSENPDIEDLLVKVEIIFSQDREFFDDVSTYSETNKVQLKP